MYFLTENYDAMKKWADNIIRTASQKEGTFWGFRRNMMKNMGYRFHFESGWCQAD